MGDEGDALQTLLQIHTVLTDDLDVHFDKKVLGELIEQATRLQKEQDRPKKKTGRRAAIEAQKARKRAAEV